MKKLIFLLLLVLFNISFALGTDTKSNNLVKIPDNFNSDCFEYYYKIPKIDLSNSLEIYKITSNKPIDFVTQNGFFLPKKYFSSNQENFNYTNDINLNNDFLTDENNNTFSELDIGVKKSFTITLDKKPDIGDFTFNFSYTSDFYSPIFYISDDNSHFYKVDIKSIENFSFKYLKIEFVPDNSNQILREKIKITELNFLNNNKTYLVKSYSNDYVEFYGKNNCKDGFYLYDEKKQDFKIDINTKGLDIKLDKNPSYNPNSTIDNDLDNDFVDNDHDNCIDNYNPDQLDTNSDGNGDVCSDDDHDGIIGDKDNCMYISNVDQIDVNINSVGDVCEFDKDKDDIFDSIDNCITDKNTDQKDSDNDGIGDICDNCNKYYNPNQKDENQNKIGDLCEQKEKELKDNDFDEDGIIDFEDNCVVDTNLNLEEKSKTDKKKYYNPKQDDSDLDGIGDTCDNCPKLQNSNQVDENKNLVGDMCEDSDGDAIEGYLDNCIYQYNIDQKDDNNNGIGNVCEDSDNDGIIFANDNCPYLSNQDQKDIDGDKKGDVCDKIDNRFIESNSTYFIGLIVFVSLVFLFGIYKMVRKIGEEK